MCQRLLRRILRPEDAEVAVFALLRDHLQKGLVNRSIPTTTASLTWYCRRFWRRTGAGIKPRITYGATDDLGFHVAENPVHVHDIQAALLHLLGFDHERLTYRHAGRDFRLTDIQGKVLKPILV